MKMKSNCSDKTKTNPFHDLIVIILVICYKIIKICSTASQMLWMC